MAWGGRRILAVVPARGGSKGIPRKNLARVGGLSLIAHAARTAAALPWIDRALLSTDDPEMAEEGRRHGLDVPFRRPAQLASDEASGAEVWRHAWLAAEAHYALRFEVSLLLQPTTPLRDPEEVERCVRAVVEEGHRTAATVSRVPAHFTPEKTLRRDPQGRLHFHAPDAAQHVNRQTIPACYYRTGAAYAARRDALVDDGEIVGKDCFGVLVEGPVVNIDEPFDLELARFLATRRAPGAPEGSRS
jgi:CMP-N-acetylneuraminic acid synthetase